MQVPSPLRSLGRGQWIWWRLHRGGVGASTVTQSSPEASESKKLIRDGIKWVPGIGVCVEVGRKRQQHRRMRPGGTSVPHLRARRTHQTVLGPHWPLTHAQQQICNVGVLLGMRPAHPKYDLT